MTDDITREPIRESGRLRTLLGRRRRLTACDLGGELSFAALYDELHPKVLRFMVRQTGAPQAALDLSAETFAKAYEKRRSFRGTTEAEACAWIWAIARNHLALHARRRSVETAAIQRLGLERPQVSESELRELEELAAIDDLRDHFRRELPQLPADQQQVIRLRFFDGFDNDEAARALGVSNDVIRARASRALRTLGANERLKEAAQALLS